MSEVETWIARAVVGAIVTACVGIFVRMRKLETRTAVAEKAVGDLESSDGGAAEIKALDDRLATVERGLVEVSSTLKALPDAREFAALGRSVTALQGEITAIRASVEGMDKMISGVGKQLDQINAHLLAGAR